MHKKLLKQSKDMITQLSNALSKITKENKELKQELKTYEKIANSEDWHTFSEAAKLLNINIPNKSKKFGRNTLIIFAKEQGILRKNNEPYQLYVDNGCAKHYLKENPNNDMIHIVPILSIKGIDLIRRLIDDESN